MTAWAVLKARALQALCERTLVALHARLTKRAEELEAAEKALRKATAASKKQKVAAAPSRGASPARHPPPALSPLTPCRRSRGSSLCCDRRPLLPELAVGCASVVTGARCCLNWLLVARLL